MNYVPDNNNNTLNNVGNTLLPTSRFLSPITYNAHESSMDESITTEHLHLANNLTNEDNLNQTNSLLNNSHHQSSVSPLDTTNCQQQMNYVDHLNDVKLENKQPIIDDLSSINSNKLNHSLTDNSQSAKIKLEPYNDSAIEHSDYYSS